MFSGVSAASINLIRQGMFKIKPKLDPILTKSTFTWMDPDAAYIDDSNILIKYQTYISNFQSDH